MAKRGPKRRPAPKQTAAKPPAPMLDMGLPTDKEAVIEHAQTAQVAGNWVEAIARWDRVRALFPEEVASYHNGIQCLEAAGRAAEREALFGAAASQFPDAVAFNAEFAWLAHHRQDWPAAIARWKTVLQRFPGHQSGYLGAAFTCSAAGMHAEADAILREAIEQHPQNREFAIGYASQAQHRGDLEAANSRWEALRRHLPAEPAGYSSGAIVLYDLNRPEDAFQLLRDAPTAVPDFEFHPQGMPGFLRYATAPQQGLTVSESDRALAMGRLSGLMRLYPDNPDVLLGYAIACRNMLAWDDAIAALKRAVAAHPERADILAETIGIHTVLDHFAEAQKLAEAAAGQFPENSAIAEKVSQLRYRQTHVTGEGGLTPAEVGDPTASRERQAVAALLWQFESLGTDCVFGYVQRAYGAEPLGLLRWASMPFARLLAALTQRFAGVGNPESIDIEATDEVHIPLGAREFTATDRSYDIWSHTFVPVVAGADLDAIRQDVARRSVFLARGLVEKLETGDKIFVYKDASGALTEADRSALMAAIAKYGPTNLLYVGLATASQPTGLLGREPSGVFIAALTAPFMTEHRVRDFQPWVGLCRDVLAAVRPQPVSPR